MEKLADHPDPLVALALSPHSRALLECFPLLPNDMLPPLPPLPLELVQLLVPGPYQQEPFKVEFVDMQVEVDAHKSLGSVRTVDL